MFDHLEKRQLLSTVTLSHGKIRIDGTSGNDTVHVARFSKSLGQVIDNGSPVLNFNISQVSGISFNGGNGNDLITIGRVNIKTFLVGGAGDDSLSSSQGIANDSLYGGDGSDYLYGGAGNDLLIGGALDDTMLGGTGNDTIVPLSSVGNDDFISGGDGIDTVDGSAYPTKIVWEIGNGDPNGLNVNDTILGDVEKVIGTSLNDKISVLSGKSINLDGGAGNDTLLTGRGNDSVTGGAGTDSISTGGGNDSIFAEDTEVDTVIGGTGTDQTVCDAFDVISSVNKVDSIVIFQ